ncbi:carbohydrate kinase family protein [Herpetosiphon llansteffanensis]|uniref:carbohydrate kinase family protein n=1 Tax=Herpetosiphon llansteffanensis TaxID=2094568 RepID=UPI000D7C019B|nr:carbohydrate kinase family protein [Herpetosiphon llansteffanensis]
MQQPIVVFGDLNLDTNVAIEQFPLDLGDTRFCFDGINDDIGGAATNVAVGLTALGHQIHFGSVIGQDRLADVVVQLAQSKGLANTYIRPDWQTTSRTVILIDHDGNRQCINDPKQVQRYRYPENALPAIFAQSQWLYCSTQNWCRYVAQAARDAGKQVIVDVQALVNVDDYHRDFLQAATVVILSTEQLAMHSHELMHVLWRAFDVEIVVATHGNHGATLGVRSTNQIDYAPAFNLGPIVDKTGAGDAFCAGFIAGLASDLTPQQALNVGQYVAASKIGVKGSTNGFPHYQQVLQALQQSTA